MATIPEPSLFRWWRDRPFYRPKPYTAQFPHATGLLTKLSGSVQTVGGMRIRSAPPLRSRSKRESTVRTQLLSARHPAKRYLTCRRPTCL